MSDHLSNTILTALADGELTGDQFAHVNEHLAGCPQCTSSALAESLLKSATSRAGQRYTPAPDLRERLERMAAQEALPPRSAPRSTRTFNSYAWVMAAALFLLCVGLFVVERGIRRPSADFAGLVTEACDLHVATLAANSPPEVISSDRHTVKPWFQGKLPFSFNLPENLPGDTTLDGANLTYLRGRPAAQLLYTIGKHRVSVFVQQRTDAPTGDGLVVNHTGFHVTGFRTADLEVVAVSDVEPTRLSYLVSLIEQAQTESQAPAEK